MTRKKTLAEEVSSVVRLHDFEQETQRHMQFYELVKSQGVFKKEQYKIASPELSSGNDYLLSAFSK